MGLSAGLLGHDAADVDQVVGNHPEADPALDTGIPLVPAAIESMPSFDHADATLAAGPPFLAVAEPALLLLAQRRARCEASQHSQIGSDRSPPRAWGRSFHQF